MKKVYKLNKENILSVLESLANNMALILENQTLFNTAINLYRNSKADFSNCLILAQSLQVETPLHTFDKRLAKHDNVKLVD